MTCRACRSGRLDPVFTMDPMPLAGAFAATQAEAQATERFPLTWLLCHDCGAVNVSPDIPDRVLFATYSYSASTVPALVRHHRDFARVLTARYRTPVRLVEIGCNDGILLRHLPAAWDTWGVDPSDVARRVPDRTYTLVDVPFSLNVAEWIGTVDVVTSSNSLAHFTDIAGALDGVALMLQPGGEFWVEVHDLDATLSSGQWDTIYHEHKAEWSVASLRAAICPRGFEFQGAWRLPLHGGLIRVLFRRGIATRSAPDLPDFTALQRAYDERRPVRAPAAYGAAGRASVYLNQCETGAAAVVDGSPLRAGKYVPGVGLPIVTPEAFDADPPERTLITAWNHAPDIRARHPGYDGWVSAW